jgi:hypothetical protein
MATTTAKKKAAPETELACDRCGKPAPRPRAIVTMSLTLEDDDGSRHHVETDEVTICEPCVARMGLLDEDPEEEV